jgi:uncharacterized phage protein (TIGR01671 family)|nr:MAG TPA_asm: YopX protein [Caudoviricetes sp.]
MREILFKAKRIDNGEWVEGYYYKISETTYCFKEDYERKPVPEHHYILQERMTDWGLPNQMVQIEIDPETLCQYTGLTDKNGNRIWENDIIQYENITAPVRFGFHDLGYGFYVDFLRETYLREELGYWRTKVIVTGNIFDNPELAKEG